MFATTENITIFHGAHPNQENKQKLQDQGVSFVEISEDVKQLSLNEVLTYLGRAGIHELWVEAGARCFSSFITKRLANRLMLYRSPKLLGNQALSISSDLLHEYTQEMLLISRQQLGDDEVSMYELRGKRIEE